MHSLSKFLHRAQPQASGRPALTEVQRSQPQLSSSVLQAAAQQANEAEWAAEVYDDEWRLQWCSDELKLLLGSEDPDELGYGKHVLEAYELPLWQNAATGVSQIRGLRKQIPYILSDTPGGAEALRGALSRERFQQVRRLRPQPPPPLWMSELEYLQGNLPPLRIWCSHQRIVDENGFHGTMRVYSPGLRASVLVYLARGNKDMFERMIGLVEPGPRKCAILFADIEASTLLSRQLSSQAFFELLAAFSKGVDDIVVAQQGIVGYHAGDGVNAFFVADELEDITAASRAAVVSAREITYLVARLEAELNKNLGVDVELRVNIGLHWSGTLYIGQVISGGQLEISALGDEVNTCARIESSATGGQVLASKHLLERLDHAEAIRLGVDLVRMTYRPLSELETVSEKALSDTRDLPVATISFPKEPRK